MDRVNESLFTDLGHMTKMAVMPILANTLQ